MRTFRDLVAAVRRVTGCSEAQGRMSVDAVLDELRAALLADDDVRIRGFGRFWNKRVGGKVIANFGRDGVIRVAPHATPAWSPAPSLKQRIKETTGGTTESTENAENAHTPKTDVPVPDVGHR